MKYLVLEQRMEGLADVSRTGKLRTGPRLSWISQHRYPAETMRSIAGVRWSHCPIEHHFCLLMLGWSWSPSIERIQKMEKCWLEVERWGSSPTLLLLTIHLYFWLPLSIQMIRGWSASPIRNVRAQTNLLRPLLPCAGEHILPASPPRSVLVQSERMELLNETQILVFAVVMEKCMCYVLNVCRFKEL